MEFENELKQYAKIVNQQLERYEREEICLEKILNESMHYSLMAGGKRLRPILMIVTYRLFKEDYETCFPYAVAMEMIHNFSLIHDDLPGIDNDDFRHGKPTNHKKFNEATAILAGDALLNYAYMVISKDLLQNNSEEKLRCFQELTVAVDRMIAGEYIDTEYEGKIISASELEYMHKNKTGALIKASVRIGAILARANQREIERLTSYAEKIGLAFQIKDDILGEIGDERQLGKPVGNDKEKGKSNYISKYGLQKSEEMLNGIIEEAIQIVENYGENGTFLKKLAIYIKQRNK